MPKNKGFCSIDAAVSDNATTLSITTVSLMSLNCGSQHKIFYRNAERHLIRVIMESVIQLSVVTLSA
jgi:hypothetical protein